MNLWPEVSPALAPHEVTSRWPDRSVQSTPQYEPMPVCGNWLTTPLGAPVLAENAAIPT